MQYKELTKLKDAIFKCASCGRCPRGPWDPYPPRGATPDRVCPIWEKYRSVSFSAEGLICIVRGLLEGKLEPTEKMIEDFYQCTLCGSCERCCKEVSGIPIEKIIRAARADFVELGFAPTKPFRKYGELVLKEGNRFGRKSSDRADWIPEGMEFPRTGDILYFTGCVAAYKSKEIAIATVKVLDKAGITPAILGENEKCCGQPAINSGLIPQYKNLTSHNVEAIKASGAKEVITSCGCCYKTLKIDNAETAGDLGYSVLHISEYLAKLSDEGKLDFTTKINEKVTYHDPCSVGRSAGVHSEPRAVIGKIPGITLVEMEGNRDLTLCCGRYPVELPELSLSTGNDRIRDAQAIGVNTIITSCSFCKWSLSRSAKEMGVDMKIVDLTEIVAKVMGL